jgi:alkylation response protein AidB-like acyl-CoA dehydrogenase
MKNNAAIASIVDEARLFADEHIRPYVSFFEENKGVPRSLIRKMGEKGLLGAVLPSNYGGTDLDAVSYGQMTEQIGKACCSTRSVLTVHTSLVGETILRFGTDEQRAYWLPLIASGERIGAFALSEPGTGSDAASVKTTYTYQNGEYIISGKKKWISLGNLADFFIVIASNEGKVTAFIVERNKTVRSSAMMGLLGNRAAHVAEIEFNQTKVSSSNVLGKEGNGFTHIINAAMDYGRYSIAWAGVAIAQEALDSMVTYARKRTQFGQKIYKFQAIQQLISQSVVNVHASRCLCMRAGQLRDEHHRDATVETIIAKYHSSKTAMQVATDAVQVHGGNGCYDEYVPERLFREAKILEIIEGTSQVLQGIISDYGLRKYHTTTHE